MVKTDDSSRRQRASRAPTRGATYVTDLTHFLDANGLPPVEAPRPLLKVLAFLGSIVQAGSSHPVGVQVSSAVPCRRWFCSRLSLTIVNGRDGTIRWDCPECGENGYLRKWQGSDYDLSAAVEPDAGLRVGILVTPEEHKVLRGIMTGSSEEEAIIAGGIATAQGVRIAGRPEDFEGLLGSIAFDANHTSSPKRRRALHAIYSRVDAMVAESAPP
jgi:hypothetical protein